MHTEKNSPGSNKKCTLNSHPSQSNNNTVNSCYCGHSWDRDLVSVLARVHNSGVREKKVLENKFTGRRLLVFTFILTAVRQTRAIFASTKSIVMIHVFTLHLQTEQFSLKQNLHLCTVRKTLSYQSLWFPTLRYCTKRLIMTNLFLFSQCQKIPLAVRYNKS